MALVQANIDCELRELLLRDKPADMLKHSPKGTVPVLITTTGQVIEESLEVMLWALQQQDSEQWLAQLAESLALIDELDQHFKPLLDRYKYSDRHPELSASQHRELTLPHAQQWEQRLSAHTFLLGEAMRLADVALFPFIRQYAMVDKPWFDQLPLPHLQRWLADFLCHPVFLISMTKFKLFNEGHRYHFPSGAAIPA